MRRLGLPLAVAASLGFCRLCQASASEEGSCSTAEGEGCVRAASTAAAAAGAAPAAAAERRHFWPNKGGNLNGSGHSDVTFGKRLDAPSWVFRPGAIVHTSPVIDDEGNVYISDTSGRITSLTRAGQTRWSYQAPGRNAGIPGLHGDALYDFTDNGVAFSVRLSDGEVRWAKKVAQGAPSDSAAVVVYGDIAIMPVNSQWASSSGNCDFVALELEDGTVRWTYSVCARSGKGSFNALPSVVDGMVVVHDQTGGMHAFSVEDGSPRWYRPGYSNHTMSTGASAVGPNDMAYCGSVREGFCDKGKGMLRAHDLYTGQIAWYRHFDEGVNAGVAVGHLGNDGPLAVVALVGNNFMPPLPEWQTWLISSWWLPNGLKLALMNAYWFRGKVIAFNADTGLQIWTFDVDEKVGWGYAGMERGCYPDAFGTPSIGGDGTVYVNWSRGISYALRDANGDGYVNPHDPAEVSKLEHTFGTNGQTAIAPGLLVAPSCDAIFGWVE